MLQLEEDRLKPKQETTLTCNKYEESKMKTTILKWLWSYKKEIATVLLILSLIGIVSIQSCRIRRINRSIGFEKIENTWK